MMQAFLLKVSHGSMMQAFLGKVMPAEHDAGLPWQSNARGA